MAEEEKPAQWVERQAQRLGVPTGFLRRIGREAEDWVYVIKINALVETALTDTIIRHLERDELDDELRRFPLGKKVQWARRMKLLDQPQLQFIEGLSTLRNAVAHNIRSIPKFRLDEAIEAMDPPMRRKLLQKWDRADLRPPGTARFAIWLAALLVLLECDRVDTDRDAARAAEEERRFADRLAESNTLQQQALQELLGVSPADNESSSSELPGSDDR